jgi:hypothetical protein
MDRPAALTILRGARIALDLVGKAWNLPNTVIGLAFGGATLGFGGRVIVGHNAIEFVDCPLMNRLAPHGAITLGNVILYGRHAHGLGPHERVHTLQGQFAGPAYLPLHALGMSLSLLSWPLFPRLRRPHCGPFHGRLNFMEGWPTRAVLFAECAPSGDAMSRR